MTAAWDRDEALSVAELLDDQSRDFIGAHTAAVLLRAADAEITRLREALTEIASQKRTDELVTVLDVEYADFEGGYDECVNRARAALAAWDASREGGR